MTGVLSALVGYPVYLERILRRCEVLKVLDERPWYDRPVAGVVECLTVDILQSDEEDLAKFRLEHLVGLENISIL